MKKNKKKKFKEDKTMENNVNVEGNNVENLEEVKVETTEEVVETQEQVNPVEGETLENSEEAIETIEEVSDISLEGSGEIIEESENIDENNQINESENNIVNDESEDNDQENIEYTHGHITNCDKLYVRQESSRASESLGIIDSSIDLIIDLTNSTEDFYKVKTSNGIEGYCVKEFIKID